MLIAHAPAGYIAAKTMRKRSTATFVICSLIFAIWPDLDLLYYYFFTSSGVFHHTYFPHLPIAMVAGLLLMLPLLYIDRFKKFKDIYLLFFINWAIHIVLDTFTGGIMWLYPFSRKLFVIIKIPAVYSHWAISFVLHWSFIIELAILICAAVLLIKTIKGLPRFFPQ